MWAFIARYQPDWLERLRLGAPLWVGPTGELALGIHHRWEARRYFVQFTCYLDESGTHGESPFMVLGGHVARLGQWNHFDHKWKKHLRKNGVTYFHSFKIWHQKGEYAGWKEDKLDKFLLKCANLLENNTLFGVTIRLSREEFETHYKGTNWPRKARPDTMYGLCARVAIVYVPQLILEAEKPRDPKVNFILEDGHEHIGDAIRVFSELRDANVAGVSQYLGECTPGAKKRFPGLQGADGIASGAWQWDMALPRPIQRGPGFDSAKVLREARGAPVFQMVIDAETLSELRAGIVNVAALRKRFGEEKRAKWLASQGVSGEQPS